MRLVVIFALTAAAFAQSSGTTSGSASGTITGNVFDLTGGKVKGAPVAATNVATKAVYKASSSDQASDQGSYTLGPLPAGVYNLSVVSPEFSPFTKENVTVTAGQTLRFDIHLVDFQFDTLGDGREFKVDQITPHATPAGPTPRTADGKPDLTGVWYAQRTVDPGKPDMLPWAEKLVEERIATNSKDSPGSHCLTRGVMAAGALFPYETVQTPARLIMIFEDDVPSHRTVYLDGRPHPKEPNPDWMGHSIGHWEGDTLAIDTVGFNDLSWIDNAGHPHTEMMHVTERIRRPDLGHLEIEFTIEDPMTYKKPWIIKRVADLAVGYEIGEYVCSEGEKDTVHMK